MDVFGQTVHHYHITIVRRCFIYLAFNDLYMFAYRNVLYFLCASIFVYLQTVCFGLIANIVCWLLTPWPEEHCGGHSARTEQIHQAHSPSLILRLGYVVYTVHSGVRMCCLYKWNFQAMSRYNLRSYFNKVCTLVNAHSDYTSLKKDWSVSELVCYLAQ